MTPVHEGRPPHIEQGPDPVGNVLDTLSVLAGLAAEVNRVMLPHSLIRACTQQGRHEGMQGDHQDTQRASGDTGMQPALQQARSPQTPVGT